MRKKWSKKVSEKSNALDLKEGIFTLKDPKKIALSLQASAQASPRKKGSEYQSAMAMLNFYINRAGKKLDPQQKNILELAKGELKKIYSKEKP